MNRWMLALLSGLALGGCTNGDKDDTSKANPTADEDGDGYDADADCDDGDPAIHPGGTESCDGLDNDCDGDQDEAGAVGVVPSWSDADQDSHGDPATLTYACAIPDGNVDNDADCNDADGAVNPDAAEVCDGADNDCDGDIDDGDAAVTGTTAFYEDLDGDGYGNPDQATEACAAPTGFTADATDCDDADASSYPDATEICDGLDNDCDRIADDGLSGATYYADIDADGYGDPDSETEACLAPPGYTTDSGDCDDLDAGTNPSMAEVCDGYDLDEDCNGLSDSDDPGASGTEIYYPDSDRDGYGSAAAGSVLACEAPRNYVADFTDCDDTNRDAYPGATEVCDDADVDEDCDGAADDADADVSGTSTLYADTDGDGYGDASSTLTSCDGGPGWVADDNDCDDADPAVTAAGAWYVDADADGYGDPASAEVTCTPASGTIASGGDCNDLDAAINAGATEVCDDLDTDEDCDLRADDADSSVADALTWYADVDHDGLGDPATAVTTCSPPEGYVLDGSDPDDGSSVYSSLGGADGVNAVLEAFLANVAADTNINWMFANTDLDNLQAMLHDQICELTGGGCLYGGGDMVTVHADMAITDAQFGYLVGDLLTALDQLAVPYTAGTYDGGLPADQLILALAAMQPDIVTDPDGSIVNFNQIGGHPALEAVMDQFVANVAADTSINGFFATTDLDNLELLLVEQTCEATGGYCTYSGRSMCDTHAGMGLTEADFDALVNDLLLALDQLGVPYALDGSEFIDPLLFTLLDMEGQVLGTDCGFTTPTVYDELGGEAGVDAVLDAFLVNVGADTNINWMFANTDLTNLHDQLADQICELTDGGCVYGGGDMVTVHADMAITDAQFGYLVGDLLAALDQLAVPYTAGTYDGGLPADTLILALAAMQPDIVTDPAGDTVLFNQLGGYASVQAVVDDFLLNVAADTNINWMFADTDLANLDRLLVEQICQETGGYCQYSGRDMVTTHAEMAITNDQFDYLVGDLLLALDHLSVPYTAGTYDGGLPADALILALAAMQPDIVTDPDGTLVNFNQIGGHAALELVMDQFLINVGADTRINSFFATTDLQTLDDLLVEQTCEATGGYCTYSGRSMCDTHAGMGLTETDFDALVEDLLAALDTLGVPYSATLDGSQPIDALLITLLGMEGQVLGTDCP